MRMRMSFSLSETKLISDLRTIFISFLKKSVAEYQNGALYETYFTPAAYKDYAFAVIPYGARFDKDDVEIAMKRIDLIWSTGNQAVGIDFYNALHYQLRKDFLLPVGNTMRLNKIILEHERGINSNSINIQFLSPLCLRNHNKNTNKDIYLSSEREGFQQLCKEIVSYQIKDVLPDCLIDSFTIMPIHAKKTVIPFHGGKIEASTGKFRFEGEPALLSFLYQYGIGSRRSAGFGCFEIM